MTHPSQQPFRRKFGGENRVESIVATQAGECRVCSRKIQRGDHVLHRAWHVESSCVQCGYVRLDDLVTPGGNPLGKIGNAFVKLAEFSSRRTPLDEWEAATLNAMGLVTLEIKKEGDVVVKKIIRWTDVGARLCRLYTAPRAQRTA